MDPSIKMLERILVPTDFSPTADKALDLALRLAEGTGGEVLLMHGVILYESDPYNPAVHVARSEELFVRLRERAEDQLEARARRFSNRGIKVQTLVERGYHPAEVVLEIAASWQVSLIVLGTHGHTGAARLLMGSTAAEVVRRAPCAVLTVREGSPETAMPPSKILLAVDFSKPTAAALEAAVSLARGFGARLEALHVLERFYYPGFYGGTHSTGALAVDYDVLASKAEPALEELLAGEEGLDTGVVTRVDAPGPGILAAAQDFEADLVIVGSRGLTGVRRWLLGSTAEYVVRHSTFPVLTVKPKQDG